MTLRIRLLGRPHLEADGTTAYAPLRRKAWAVLAVLLLADRPLSRRGLATLLFPEAEDPLGALRWTLSQLRRALRAHIAIDGDPVVLRLAPECHVDVIDLFADDGTDEAAILGPPEALLDGADGLAGPDFDLWLTAARHRVNTARGVRLRRSAGQAIDDANPSVAVTMAAHAVAVEPDQPSARATLIGSLVAAGDHEAALTQLTDWSTWIRQELRLNRLMADRRPGDSSRIRALSDTDAMCRIDAGQAAMAAGAIPIGLEHLRDAVRLAAQRDDDRLQAAALLALGSGLAHAVAAHTVEAKQALRETVRLGQRSGDRRVTAEALRDLAYVENTSGRVEPTHKILMAAASAAGDDGYSMSSVRAIEGMFLADRGEHSRALLVLRNSAELAESAGRIRQAAWSISIASRSLLLRGELDTARDYAERSARIAGEQHWTAMLPWMEAILAELDLANGNTDDAERRLRYAWSLSLVLGDWCWQGMVARGLGLLNFARGNLSEALRWLDEADRRATEDRDRYAWIHAWVQEATCRVTVAAGLDRAPADVDRLARIAAGACLPDFAVQADLHRAALGAHSGPRR